MSTRSRPRREHRPDRPAAADLSAAGLFELFGDEYTRRVYAAIAEEPRSGRAVAEAADVSRATAYRRLNDLCDAGLARTEMEVRGDGHHRQRFEAVTAPLSVPLDRGLDAAVRVDD